MSVRSVYHTVSGGLCTGFKMCSLILHRDCCILDYVDREKCGYNFDNTLYVVRLMATSISVSHLAGRSANYVRDHFANKFVVSEGAIH